MTTVASLAGTFLHVLLPLIVALLAAPRGGDCALVTVARILAPTAPIDAHHGTAWSPAIIADVRDTLGRTVPFAAGCLLIERFDPTLAMVPEAATATTSAATTTTGTTTAPSTTTEPSTSTATTAATTSTLAATTNVSVEVTNATTIVATSTGAATGSGGPTNTTRPQTRPTTVTTATTTTTTPPVPADVRWVPVADVSGNVAAAGADGVLTFAAVTVASCAADVTQLRVRACPADGTQSTSSGGGACTGGESAAWRQQRCSALLNVTLRPHRTRLRLWIVPDAVARAAATTATTATTSSPAPGDVPSQQQQQPFNISAPPPPIVAVGGARIPTFVALLLSSCGNPFRFDAIAGAPGSVAAAPAVHVAGPGVVGRTGVSFVPARANAACANLFPAFPDAACAAFDEVSYAVAGRDALVNVSLSGTNRTADTAVRVVSARARAVIAVEARLILMSAEAVATVRPLIGEPFSQLASSSVGGGGAAGGGGGLGSSSSSSSQFAPLIGGGGAAIAVTTGADSIPTFAAPPHFSARAIDEMARAQEANGVRIAMSDIQEGGIVIAAVFNASAFAAIAPASRGGAAFIVSGTSAAPPGTWEHLAANGTFALAPACSLTDCPRGMRNALSNEPGAFSARRVFSVVEVNATTATTTQLYFVPMMVGQVVRIGAEIDESTVIRAMPGLLADSYKLVAAGAPRRAAVASTAAPQQSSQQPTTSSVPPPSTSTSGEAIGGASDDGALTLTVEGAPPHVSVWLRRVGSLAFLADPEISFLSTVINSCDCTLDAGLPLDYGLSVLQLALGSDPLQQYLWGGLFGNAGVIVASYVVTYLLTFVIDRLPATFPTVRAASWNANVFPHVAFTVTSALYPSIPFCAFSLLKHLHSSVDFAGWFVAAVLFPLLFPLSLHFIGERFAPPYDRSVVTIEAAYSKPWWVRLVAPLGTYDVRHHDSSRFRIAFEDYHGPMRRYALFTFFRWYLSAAVPGMAFLPCRVRFVVPFLLMLVHCIVVVSFSPYNRAYQNLWAIIFSLAVMLGLALQMWTDMDRKTAHLLNVVVCASAIVALVRMALRTLYWWYAKYVDTGVARGSLDESFLLVTDLMEVDAEHGGRRGAQPSSRNYHNRRKGRNGNSGSSGEGSAPHTVSFSDSFAREMDENGIDLTCLHDAATAALVNSNGGGDDDDVDAENDALANDIDDFDAASYDSDDDALRVQHVPAVAASSIIAHGAKNRVFRRANASGVQSGFEDDQARVVLRDEEQQQEDERRAQYLASSRRTAAAAAYYTSTADRGGYGIGGDIATRRTLLANRARVVDERVEQVLAAQAAAGLSDTVQAAAELDEAIADGMRRVTRPVPPPGSRLYSLSFDAHAAAGRAQATLQSDAALRAEARRLVLRRRRAMTLDGSDDDQHAPPRGDGDERAATTRSRNRVVTMRPEEVEFVFEEAESRETAARRSRERLAREQGRTARPQLGSALRSVYAHQQAAQFMPGGRHEDFCI